jgi:hypothetical protein
LIGIKRQWKFVQVLEPDIDIQEPTERSINSVMPPTDRSDR